MWKKKRPIQFKIIAVHERLTLQSDKCHTMYDKRTHMSVFLNHQYKKPSHNLNGISPFLEDLVRDYYYPNFWPPVTIQDQAKKVK